MLYSSFIRTSDHADRAREQRMNLLARVLYSIGAGAVAVAVPYVFYQIIL